MPTANIGFASGGVACFYLQFCVYLKRGVYLAPAQFEALFVSTAHSKEDLDKTIKANKEVLEAIM